MTPDWWGIGKIVLAVICTLGFAWFMLIKFVEKVFKGCDSRSLRQINDEINRQVEQSEMPGDVTSGEVKYDPGLPDTPYKLEPESLGQWRKKWGIGEK